MFVIDTRRMKCGSDTESSDSIGESPPKQVAHPSPAPPPAAPPSSSSIPTPSALPPSASSPHVTPPPASPPHVTPPPASPPLSAPPPSAPTLQVSDSQRPPQPKVPSTSNKAEKNAEKTTYFKNSDKFIGTKKNYPRPDINKI